MIPEKPAGPHPDVEVLLRAHRAPAETASRAVLDHAAVCAGCSAELAAIEEFDPRTPDLFGVEERRTEKAWAKFSGASAPRRPKVGHVPVFALAATVFLAAALALFLPRHGADVLRGGGTPQGAFSPAGEIPDPPVEFRFPRSGAASVRVSVFDAERRYVWTSAPSAPGEPVAFPEAERARLRPGITYTWVVLGDGHALPARTFSLRR